jgi:hypothetical protein
MLTRTRTLIACAAAATAVGLAAGIAAPALASPATPSSTATTSLARVYTQSSGQESIPVPGGPNQFIPVDSSPVLPVGHYAYTMVIDINNVAPGSEVLCGQQTRPSAGQTSGDYGIVDNTGGSAPISGHCVLSGVANITQPNSTMSFWTTVYSGPTGADVFGWSMTETKVGTVTYTP